MRHHVVVVAEIVLASCSILYHNNNEGRFSSSSSFFFGKFFSRPLPERLLFTVLCWDDNNRERASPWRSLGLCCCRLSTERWKAASLAVASKRSTVVGRLTFAPLFCLGIPYSLDNERLREKEYLCEWLWSLQIHFSSEIRGFCLIKWPGKTHQNLPYLLYKT